jgi:hypothetical protein
LLADGDAPTEVGAVLAALSTTSPEDSSAPCTSDSVASVSASASASASTVSRDSAIFATNLQIKRNFAKIDLFFLPQSPRTVSEAIKTYVIRTRLIAQEYVIIFIY